MGENHENSKFPSVACATPASDCINNSNVAQNNNDSNANDQHAHDADDGNMLKASHYEPLPHPNDLHEEFQRDSVHDENNHAPNASATDAEIS